LRRTVSALNFLQIHVTGQSQSKRGHQVNNDEGLEEMLTERRTAWLEEQQAEFRGESGERWKEFIDSDDIKDAWNEWEADAWKEWIEAAEAEEWPDVEVHLREEYGRQ
jgi:hypothetical protein